MLPPVLTIASREEGSRARPRCRSAGPPARGRLDSRASDHAVRRLIDPPLPWRCIRHSQRESGGPSGRARPAFRARSRSGHNRATDPLSKLAGLGAARPAFEQTRYAPSTVNSHRRFRPRSWRAGHGVPLRPRRRWRRPRAVEHRPRRAWLRPWPPSCARSCSPSTTADGPRHDARRPDRRMEQRRAHE